MSRYLTPSKVALLCLVSLYTEGVVPNASAVAVLSFLVSHILPVNTSVRSPATFSRDRDHAVAIEELEEVLSYHSSSIPGRSLWDLFLRKIWSLDCCDALETFFSEISSLVEKSREEQIEDRNNGIPPQTSGDKMLLSRGSPLGAFVRRCQLEFTRLQFQDSVKLWRGFIKYRLPTFHAWARRNPSAEHTAVDMNLAAIGADVSSPLGQAVYGNIGRDVEEEASISTKDVERLLEFQVGELQRVGGRVPDEVKSQLEYIISTGVTVPSLSHYLRFLDAWRAGDYPSAFDNLHRYFDYTMHNRDRSFYQYALLNLAILQADFGSHSEAVSAMQEAIAIARESHDMHCLNFCMSWMYHFGKAFPEEIKDVQNTGMLGSEKDGLAFLKAKAKETEMWGLFSTTQLSEAKLELQNGESLASVFENITKAAHLNVTKNLLTSVGPQLLLQSSLFTRVGLTHLALLHNEVLRECYVKEAPLEDYLKSTFLSCQLLSNSGSHKRAMARITDIPQHMLRSLRASQQWTFYAGLLKLQREIYRDNIAAVEHLFSQLKSIQLPEVDLTQHLSFLEIEFCIRKGDYRRAMDIIEDIAQSMQQENFDVYTQIRILCDKARILDKTGQPRRGFSLAMRASRLAYQSRVLSGLWEAIGVLSRVLLSLREFEAAEALMESIMPQVLEFEDRALTARSYSVLVDANMGMAGDHSPAAVVRKKQTPTAADAVKQQEYIARAVAYIDCAYGEYEKIEDLPGQCEMMAKKAMAMQLSGDPALANDYAAKYLDLKKQMATDSAS